MGKATNIRAQIAFDNCYNSVLPYDMVRHFFLQSEGMIMLNTRKLIITAIMSAMAIVLAYAIHVPFVPGLPFEYDPADIPIFFVTYMFGVPYGIIMTIIVSFIQGFAFSASGIIGVTMRIFATGLYVIVVGLIFKYWRTRVGLIISAVIGAIVWTISMVLWNIIFVPLFMGTPREAVIQMLVPIILPFNIMRSTVNGALSILLYFALYRITVRYAPPMRKLNKNSIEDQNKPSKIDTN